MGPKESADDIKVQKKHGYLEARRPQRPACFQVTYLFVFQSSEHSFWVPLVLYSGPQVPSSGVGVPSGQQDLVWEQECQLLVILPDAQFPTRKWSCLPFCDPTSNGFCPI